MKTCKFIGNFVNFDPSDMTFCCAATDEYPVAIRGFSGGPFPLEEFRASVDRLNERNNTDHPGCGKCVHLVEAERPFPVAPRFQNIVFNTFKTCNLRCVYCHYDKDDATDANYDLSVTLRDMLSRDLIDARTLVNWGGGEPTVSKDFETILTLLSDHKLFQHVNTNAVHFSQALCDALRKGNVGVQVSVDAGTKETFQNVKGRDSFDRVWKNIAKYCDASPRGVEVKYILMEENSGTAEYLAFVDQMVDARVRKAVITPEYAALYASRYSEDLLRDLVVLAALLEAEGIDVHITTEQMNEQQAKIFARYNTRQVRKVIRLSHGKKQKRRVRWLARRIRGKIGGLARGI